MTAETELKPCPFCGARLQEGKDKWHHAFDPNREHQCVLLGTVIHMADTIRINDWNTRPAVSDAAVEVVRKYWGRFLGAETMAELLSDLRALPAAPDNASDDPVLPCHLRVGNTRFRKGVKVSTAQLGIDRLANAYRDATEGKSISELLAPNNEAPSICSEHQEPDPNCELCQTRLSVPSNEARLREALENIQARAQGCISANDLAQYASWRENEAEGVKLNAKVKTAQTVINIEAITRTALEDQ